MQILDDEISNCHHSFLMKDNDVQNQNDPSNYNSKSSTQYQANSETNKMPSSHSLPIKSGLTSWDEEIEQFSDDIAGLNEFIQSSSSEVLTQIDAQGRTICHALGSLRGHHSSAKDLPELLSQACLRDCMTCRDSFGNTPLHCIVEAQNSNTLESVLRLVPDVAEGLRITNRDNSTPLDVAFEKKLWVPARVLAEHRIKTGENHAFLQDYFFKAMREQGGVDFLAVLLDLWVHYYPQFNLNFGVDATGRTPWWYLVNSNDVSVMCRALQALRNHSVDFASLQTHTDAETTLVQQAVETNRLLFMIFQKVSGWGHSDTDQDTADRDLADQDMETTLGSSRALSQVSSCCSVTDSTSSDLSESESNIQPQHDMSCKDVHSPPVLLTSDQESVSETALRLKSGHKQKNKRGKVRG